MFLSLFWPLFKQVCCFEAVGEAQALNQTTIKNLMYKLKFSETAYTKIKQKMQLF